MIKKITDYYKSESNCYILPGKRDYISIKNPDNPSERIQLQKRLLLHTLRELYENFKIDYGGKYVTPKFSFFASLRPPECIIAGAPGTHTICVCQEHENVRLKLYKLSKGLKYKDLLNASVCNADNAECMLHRCKDCPGIMGIEKELNYNNITWPTEKIKYQKWQIDKSRAFLVDIEENVLDYKGKLLNDLSELTKHHYLSESQKNYLNHCKETLTPDTAIVLMDFSGNYSFVIQRSVQAFYYNNSQATLHPFILYFKDPDDNDRDEKSFCVISDTTDHFAYTVHSFQREFLKSIREQYPWIKSILYFSDGAPNQYKNKNNFSNICRHSEDFGFDIKSWNFFATSHGKSPCDAIGGTIKRAVMRHCYRRESDGQITTPKAMFEFADQTIKSVRSLWVADTQVQKDKKSLTKRFEAAKYIQGTRSFHHYVPTSNTELEVKTTAYDMDTTKVTVCKGNYR